MLEQGTLRDHSEHGFVFSILIRWAFAVWATALASRREGLRVQATPLSWRRHSKFHPAIAFAATLTMALVSACQSNADTQPSYYVDFRDPAIISSTPIQYVAELQAHNGHISESLDCATVDWLKDAGNRSVPLETRLAAQTIKLCRDTDILRLGAAIPAGMSPIENGFRLESNSGALYVLSVGPEDGSDPFLCCSVPPKMSRIGGSNNWWAGFRVTSAEESILSFIPPNKLSSAPFENLLVIRGDQASPPPPENQLSLLDGKVEALSIYSHALQDFRKVSVYTPREHAAGAYPVLFLTDGAMDVFVGIIDKMIAMEAIPPTVIVAVDSSQARMTEYVANPSPGYEQHMEFFTGELRSWAITHLEVTTRADQTLVAGFSNGAVFALDAALKHPGVYGGVVAMSPGVLPFDALPKDFKCSAHFQVSAGHYEAQFVTVVKQLETALSQAGCQTTSRYMWAGHFQDQWKSVLFEALAEHFR